MSKSNIRSFIALPVDYDVLKKISKYLYKYDNDKDLRFEPKEKWHITTNFLGNILHDDVYRTCEILNKIEDKFRSFNISLKEINLFPENKPRLIALQIELSNELINLRREITEELRLNRIGQSGRKAFVPHITLAHLSKDNIPSDFQISLNVETRIKHIDFIESKLTHRGSEYILLKRFTLNE
ncbi:RNA 2',3'-cyclic phosphodiesterase [Patescibacteria group bacterium]|nr:RNA 2',3'-cyclic phosphodiesterase [Patescibacteria group bacterium]MBU1890740.1 RNA 2',3'-cyclic phosphodiesterase [Patescibacteria group bacterium]